MRTPNSRRSFVKNTLGAMSMITLPSLIHSENRSVIEKKKIVVVGGHPDDPESGCGGTIPLLIEAGNDVTLMYFTNGDGGIAGKSNEEASSIRKKEAIEACKVLGAKPFCKPG
jgi:LmbE family N-acetylglucosaminyl deacetylase